MTRRLATTALLAALAALAMAAPAARADVRPGFYGVNAPWVFSTPPATWPAQLSAIAAGGLQTVRTDARWSIAEPTPPSASGQHTYDWSTYDAIAGALARYGLRWMPTLEYPPPWAQENPSDTGSEMTLGHVPDFLAFATALVRRYGAGGSFWAQNPSLPYMPVREWELWDEPNVIYYWDPQDQAPERYADLYLATRQAIKQVNFKATVLVGGLGLELDNPPIAGSEIGFVQRMFAHRPELKNSVDVWGLHPYQETIYWTFRRLARWRQALDLLAGRREPIAITELGYTTTKVSDAERGQELSELTQELPRSGCDVYDFLPYTWLSPEQNPNDPEQWFGIWNHDGTPKPSGQQFVGAVLQMRGLSSTPPAAGQLNLCDSQYPVPPDTQPPAAPQALPAPAAAPPPAPAPASPPAAPAAVPPPKPHGPRIRVSLRRDRRHRLLRVSARCATPCKLDAYLMARRRGKSGYRTQSVARSRSFNRRSTTLRLRLPAKSRRLLARGQLVLVAFDRSGASTRNSRRIRLF